MERKLWYYIKEHRCAVTLTSGILGLGIIAGIGACEIVRNGDKMATEYQLYTQQKYPNLAPPVYHPQLPQR